MVYDAFAPNCISLSTFSAILKFNDWEHYCVGFLGGFVLLHLLSQPLYYLTYLFWYFATSVSKQSSFHSPALHDHRLFPLWACLWVYASYIDAVQFTDMHASVWVWIVCDWYSLLGETDVEAWSSTACTVSDMTRLCQIASTSKCNVRSGTVIDKLNMTLTFVCLCISMRGNRYRSLARSLLLCSHLYFADRLDYWASGSVFGILTLACMWNICKVGWCWIICYELYCVAHPIM